MLAAGAIVTSPIIVEKNPSIVAYAIIIRGIEKILPDIPALISKKMNFVTQFNKEQVNSIFIVNYFLSTGIERN